MIRVDDLDGSEGAQPIRYMVDGQEYEIDLSEQNARKFHAISGLLQGEPEGARVH